MGWMRFSNLDDNVAVPYVMAVLKSRSNGMAAVLPLSILG